MSFSGREPRARAERGASAVEFALVLPMLVLLLFGIVSYAYMFSVRQALSQATAEGARAAAVAPAADTVSEALAAVNSAVGSFGLACGSGGLVCTPLATSCSGSPCVKVTVSYAYKTNTPVKFPLVPLPDTMRFTSSARTS